MVLVGFGRGPIPDGALPVFSVDTEEDAKNLLTAACPTNIKGEWFAPELARDQTLDNLNAFSDRLAYYWDLISKNKRKMKKKPS